MSYNGQPDYTHVYWTGGAAGLGSPYWKDATGKPVYIPPLSAAQDSDPNLQKWAQLMGLNGTYNNGQLQSVQDTGRPGADFFHSGGTWNGDTGQWDMDFDPTNLLSAAVGGFIAAPLIAPAFGGAAGGEVATMGMPSALPGAYSTVPALSGAGAVGGATGALSTLPSTTIGNGMATLPAGGAGADVTGALSGLSNALPSQQIGNGMVSSTPQGASGADVAGSLVTGGGSSFMDYINKMPPAVKAALGIGTAIAGRVAGQAGADSAVPPELTQLLNMGLQRAQSQQGLFDATTQGAYAMLPDFAKQGRAVPRG